MNIMKAQGDGMPPKNDDIRVFIDGEPRPDVAAEIQANLAKMLSGSPFESRACLLSRSAPKSLVQQGVPSNFSSAESR